MSATYCGIALPLATPELEDLLASRHPLDVIPEFDWSHWTGHGTEDLQTPMVPEIPPIRLGTLRWPRDASRFATYHCVVNSSKKAEIEAALGTTTTTSTSTSTTTTSTTTTTPPGNSLGSLAGLLVLDDGRDGQQISATMYPLPMRPLAQIGGDDDDLYLLTLVDIRFWLRWKTGSITAKPASWTALFETLESLLGIDLTIDTVDADYKSPSRVWIQHYQPLTTLLDAAAASVGQRVVFRFNGTAATQKATTAKTNSDAQYADIQKVLGGQIQTADIRRYVPANIDVLFAQWEFDAGEWVKLEAPYVVTKQLSSLAVSGYSSATGVQSHSAIVHADYSYDGANAADCSALAAQAATDWYQWRLADVDVTLPGVEPWIPTAYEDAVEWTYRLGNPEPLIATRIVRGEWMWYPSGTFTGEPPTTTTPAPCTGECEWTWNVGSQEWEQTGSTCESGCSCYAPRWCPPTAYRGDPVVTLEGCGRFDDDMPPISCNGTTTTSPPACTTTEPPECEGTCRWMVIDFDARGCPVMVLLRGTDTHPRCDDPVTGCRCPTLDAFTLCGDHLGGETWSLCEIFETSCVRDSLPAYCNGECNWRWSFVYQEWIQYGGCLPASGRQCHCDPPRWTPDPDDEFCYEEKTCCYDARDPVCSPCRPTTPPPDPCGGDCLWAADGSGGWYLKIKCPGLDCGCSDPPFASTDPNELTRTPCIPTNTTTTSTTTTEPPCGTCEWTCLSDPICWGGEAAWGFTASYCNSPCGCLHPSQVAYFAEGTPYLTVRSIPCYNVATTTTTTTTPAPCGTTCEWVCLETTCGPIGFPGAGTWTLNSSACTPPCGCLYPPFFGNYGSVIEAGCVDGGTTTTTTTTTGTPSEGDL